jgi:predicted SAM-dependent methyltransferase
LREWIRVIKPGGKLIIYCPDEQIYREHCRITNQTYNTFHKHDDFSLKKVSCILGEIGKTKTIYENAHTDIYSWDLVVEKI